MSKEKAKIRQMVVDADVYRQDWHEEILEQCADLYARGYLTAKLESLDDCVQSNEEEFREAFLDYITYEIWGKSNV